MCRHFVGFCILLFGLVLFGCGGGGSGGEGTTGTQWQISPAGGTFQTAANEVKLVVPAGAVVANTAVTAEPMTTPPTPPLGTAYVPNSGWHFTHVMFSAPASLSLRFPAGTPTAGLRMYRLAEGAIEWEQLATTIDAGAHTATAQTNGFSSYALFYPAGTGWMWTSAGGTFDFENLSVSVPDGAVGETVEVQPRRTPSPFAAPEGWEGAAGATFDLGSSDTELETAQPFTVAITYADTAIPGDARAGARIFYKQNADAAWQLLSTTSDVEHLKLTATSQTLGTFAAFYPLPMTANIYWVEQRSAQNGIFLDIFTAESGGPESQVYSVNRIQGDNALRSETFRWSDSTMLGIEFAHPDFYLMSFNVQTNVASRLFLLPHATGMTINSVEMARASRTAGSQDVLLSISERNGTEATARDRLLMFRNGSSTPEVLISHDRPDGDPPAIMRPWDVAADGRALALTSDGLVMFTGTTQQVLANADLGPGPAFFSPSGHRVLFQQLTGGTAGWKVIDLDTSTTTPIPELAFGRSVRWGEDDSHVLAATVSGAARPINIVSVSSGASSLITNAGNRSTSMITELGSR